MTLRASLHCVSLSERQGWFTGCNPPSQGQLCVVTFGLLPPLVAVTRQEAVIDEQRQENSECALKSLENHFHVAATVQTRLYQSTTGK